MTDTPPPAPQIEAPKKLPTCGIVMPISAIDNCDERHWGEVKNIISESIEKAGFSPNLVSNADEVGVIHKTIVKNLYENPIVVCDVSGKNPNVMFELGIRLTFDKPTVIIKDDKTNYAFDTQIIEHVPYPRDLRYASIVTFKKTLEDKIRATFKKKQDDPSFSQFLTHIGPIQTPTLGSQPVEQFEYLSTKLDDLADQMDSLADRVLKKPKLLRGVHFVPDRETKLTSDIDRCIEAFGLLDLIGSIYKTNPKDTSSEVAKRVVEAVKELDPSLSVDFLKAAATEAVKRFFVNYFHETRN